MNIWIDRLINWLKWPAAVVALTLLPGAAIAMVELLVKMITHPLPLLPFLCGFFFYGFAWWAFFRRWRLTFFLTLEHELTHALFAIATFHRVTGMRATLFRGGHVRFVGTGNWLITVAPYFFPTLSLLLLVPALILPGFLANAANFLIGGSVAYHLTSTLHETHPGQTDLQQTGMLFCLFFLPSANLVMFGILLGYVSGGWAGSAHFVGSIWERTMGILG